MKTNLIFLLSTLTGGCVLFASEDCPSAVFLRPPTDGSTSVTSSSSGGAGGNSSGEGGFGGSASAPLCQYSIECAHLTTAACTVGQCENGSCAAKQAEDGSFCVPELGANPGVCFSGACVDDVACDDGNACTDDFVAPNGACVGLTTYVYARSCSLGSGEGICAQGACVCDSDDDCDDGIVSTPDICLDFICFH